MIAPPHIVQTLAQTAAVIHLTVPRTEMMKVFGPAVGELAAVLAVQGVEPVGAIFAHHLSMSGDTFDFNVGVRVAAPIAASGRVVMGALPAAQVARTIYTGPYEGLPSAWRAFSAWIEANGHTPAGDLWEVYAVGPQETSDPASWQTELNRPLLRLQAASGTVH